MNIKGHSLKKETVENIGESLKKPSKQYSTPIISELRLNQTLGRRGRGSDAGGRNPRTGPS